MIPRWYSGGALRRLLTCGFAASILWSQEAPKKAVFEGFVRDPVTSQPILKASIHLISTAQDKPAYAGTSGAEGAFRFEAIEPGDYRIEVTQRGYTQAKAVLLKSGRTSSNLRFAAGDSVAGAVISLSPRAVITGRVTDAAGDPFPFATIRAVTEQWQRGIRIYQTVDAMEADDRGEYRLPLDSGRYFVSAAPRFESAKSPRAYTEAPGGQEMQIGRVIYPNARTVAVAAPILLQPGQQLSGIDFKLVPVSSYHVRGSIKPLFNSDRTYVQLWRRDGDRVSGRSMGVLEKDGSFDVSMAEPGDFQLELWPIGPRPTGRMFLTVTNKDVDGVTLPAMWPSELKARVRFEEDDASSALSMLKLHIEELDWSEIHTDRDISLNPEGAFVAPNMGCAEYVITLAPERDAYIKSISKPDDVEIEGARIDLTKGPIGELNILLGTGTGHVQGTVRWPERVSDGSEPPPRPNVTAVLVSAKGRTGNTGARSAEIDPAGSFQFRFVPPGRYFFFVVTSFDPGLWQNMEFVKEVESRGVAVELSKRGSAQAEVPILFPDDVRSAIDRLGK